jgi:Ca2+-binding RTX toxin-like protein
MFEQLEFRQLLAFAASVTSGTLDVRSGADMGTVTVVERNGFVEVYGDTIADGYRTFSGISKINIWGNTGNDTLRYDGNTIGAQVRGNSGADHIFVSDIGSGSSDVDGENDNDVIVIVKANHTNVTGGSGNDTIEVNTGYTVDPNEFDYVNAECVVVAGSGDDVVITRAGRTTINGGSGTDEVIDTGGAATTNTLIKVEVVTNA